MKGGLRNQEGFVKWIIIIIIALVILGFFGFDIKKAVEAPATQSNLNFAEQLTLNIWHNYLQGPVSYIWGKTLEFLKDHCYPQLLCYIVGAK